MILTQNQEFSIGRLIDRLIIGLLKLEASSMTSGPPATTAPRTIIHARRKATTYKIYSTGLELCVGTTIANLRLLATNQLIPDAESFQASIIVVDTVCFRPTMLLWKIHSVTAHRVVLKRDFIMIVRNFPTSDLIPAEFAREPPLPDQKAPPPPPVNDESTGSSKVWSALKIAAVVGSVAIGVPSLVSGIGTVAGLGGAARITYGLARLGGSMMAGIGLIAGGSAAAGAAAATAIGGGSKPAAAAPAGRGGEGMAAAAGPAAPPPQPPPGPPPSSSPSYSHIGQRQTGINNNNSYTECKQEEWVTPEDDGPDDVRIVDQGEIVIEKSGHGGPDPGEDVDNVDDITDWRSVTCTLQNTDSSRHTQSKK